MSRKLEIGYKNLNFEVRKYAFSLSNVDRELSIIYLSDTHFTGFSRPLSKRLIQTLKNEQPDLVLLGGDYADSRAGLDVLKGFFLEVSRLACTVAILGNHDTFWGGYKIVEAGLGTTVKWLRAQSMTVKIKGHDVRIDRSAQPIKAAKLHLNILLLHEPVNWKDSLSGYNLILAGHLHGCQFVWFRRGQKLYPGAWFYKNNFLWDSRQNTHYLISKGLGDTLPIRYNCPRDILRINLVPKN